jgi:hypothetical protein
MSQICDPRSYHLPKLRYAAVNLGTELDVIAIDENANFKTIVSGEPIEARPSMANRSRCRPAANFGFWRMACALQKLHRGGTAAHAVYPV